RDPGAAYARCAQRLHPGRRHRLCQHTYGVDLSAAGRQSRAWRRILLQSASARARGAEGDWKELRRRRRGAGACRAARSRHTTRNRHACRHQPGAPKGYPDDEASWIDGMGRRLDVANNFAERVAATADPKDIIETVFASTVSDEVKQAVGRAESRQQALALLFMSAEFQRR